MSHTPSPAVITPRLKANTIANMLKRGVRSSGRTLTDYRPTDIVVGYVQNADGSALVRLGNTVVVAGVKLEVGSPYPDAPSEGALVVNAEFMPTASPTFEPGPPDENAIELARVIDRALRELKVVDMSKLAIVPGRKVWVVYVDIYVLDHDGNLVDASSIATLTALLNTTLPKVEVDELGNVRVDRSVRVSPLPINNKVVTVTVARTENVLFVDPDLDEESVVETKLVIAVSDDGRIAGIQKSGSGGLAEAEVLAALDIALKTGVNLIKTVESKVSEAASGHSTSTLN
ncbi:MAG: exosome complex protein Rrp42 [Sulfolobales archaeon]|nr:exosome complex protein Rrp42 [Sulfolobales archaeon]MCX8208945.1 exosome complex protein Rrp42 [Sulfolobales archaeon]MDW8010401.1 exosome complex protein Rrp42 [Sulfolobales archaeon]